METEEIIEQLEREKQILITKAERIQSAIDNLKPIEEELEEKKSKPHHKKCELCNEKDARAIINGKSVCMKCFDITKKGEDFVNRKEKNNPDEYDESEITVDDDFLEDE